jgi:hypothetical protein
VGELNAIVDIFTAATLSQLVKSPRTDDIDNKLLQIFFIQLALSLIEIHRTKSQRLPILLPNVTASRLFRWVYLNFIWVKD